jgi:hypothetical protein
MNKPPASQRDEQTASQKRVLSPPAGRTGSSKIDSQRDEPQASHPVSRMNTPPASQRDEQTASQKRVLSPPAGLTNRCLRQGYDMNGIDIQYRPLPRPSQLQYRPVPRPSGPPPRPSQFVPPLPKFVPSKLLKSSKTPPLQCPIARPEAMPKVCQDLMLCPDMMPKDCPETMPKACQDVMPKDCPEVVPKAVAKMMLTTKGCLQLRPTSKGSQWSLPPKLMATT